MRPQLVMALVMEAFDGRLLDGAVHPLDLSVGPRVVRLGEAVFDVVCLADHVEAHLARPGGVAVARLLGELGLGSCGCGKARLSAGTRP